MNQLNTNNPLIFEINTRVWIKQFESELLIDIPQNHWKKLADKGFNFVWLMGIWETIPSANERYCFDDALVDEYGKAVPDWQKEDVAGSPYAINAYELNPIFGKTDDLLELKNILNNAGLKLILDFIPNHFHSESNLVLEKPELFLRGTKKLLEEEPDTFFKSDKAGFIFAHGRDPFFPAWKDTIQIDYSKPQSRKFMYRQLSKVSALCDGVRCDMSMLQLNNVFKNTWSHSMANSEYDFPQKEFWEEAILLIKSVKPEFVFISEVYWDLEWQMQQLGFDFTYDKKLLDRIKLGNAESIKEHLFASTDYQKKSIRFIENHDEQRSYKELGKKKSMAASVIISTIMGMRFYFDGQFEGFRIKIPVQLNKQPKEIPAKCISEHYAKLLEIINSDVFKLGEWNLLDISEAWKNNESFVNIIAWEWRYENDSRIIVVNYSESKSQCRVKFEVSSTDEIELCDLLHEQKFVRSTEEISSEGLYIDLDPYKCHIFRVCCKKSDNKFIMKK